MPVRGTRGEPVARLVKRFQCRETIPLAVNLKPSAGADCRQQKTGTFNGAQPVYRLLVFNPSGRAILPLLARKPLPPLLTDESDRRPLGGKRVGIDDLQPALSEPIGPIRTKVLAAPPVREGQRCAVNCDETECLALTSKRSCLADCGLNVSRGHARIAEKIVRALPARARTTDVEHTPSRSCGRLSGDLHKPSRPPAVAKVSLTENFLCPVARRI